MSETNAGGPETTEVQAKVGAEQDTDDEQMHTIDELSIEMAVVVIFGMIALILALAAPEGYRVVVFLLAGLFFWIGSALVLWRAHLRWRRRHHRG